MGTLAANILTGRYGVNGCARKVARSTRGEAVRATVDAAEHHQRPAALARQHVVERRRDAVQRDPFRHQRAEVQAARPDVLGEHREVLGRVRVAVDAAGEGAAPVEDLQGVEGDLLVLAADADDRRTAAAAGGVPGRADGRRAAHALDGDVDALLAGEAADLAGGGVGGDDVVGGSGRPRQLLLLRGDVDRDDLRGARDPGRLEGGEAHSPDAEHRDRLALAGPAPSGGRRRSR